MDKIENNNQHFFVSSNSHVFITIGEGGGGFEGLVLKLCHGPRATFIQPCPEGSGLEYLSIIEY